MTENLNVVSFSERLRVKKEQEEKEASEVAEAQMTPDDIATGLLAELEDEVKRQKENVEIWLDELDDLYDECESVNELVNFANCLSLYSTDLLSHLIEDKELCDKEFARLVAFSLSQAVKPLMDLSNKLEEIINKGE